jgi:amino acid transporter
VPDVLAAKDAQGNTIPAAIAILQTALGARIGNALAALASMAMWFCGLSCVTSASRAVYALARDKGMPASNIFSRVSTKRGTPGAAIWGVVIATILTMAWSGAVPVVTSLSTVALYVAYILPVMFGLWARKQSPSWSKNAHWSLGRWGTPINIIAIVYTSLICVVLIMPPNQLSGKTLAGVVLALIAIYLLAVRNKFTGPEWAHKSTVLHTGDSNS